MILPFVFLVWCTVLPSNADNNIGIRIQFKITADNPVDDWCYIDYVTIYGYPITETEFPTNIPSILTKIPSTIPTITPTESTNIPTNTPSINPTFGSIHYANFDILYGPDIIDRESLNTNWISNNFIPQSSPNTGYNGPSIDGVHTDGIAVYLEGGDHFYLNHPVSTIGYKNIIVQYGMFNAILSPLDNNEYCQIEYSINNSTNWVLVQRYTQNDLEKQGNSRSVLWDTPLPYIANENYGIRIKFENTGNDIYDACYIDYVIVYGIQDVESRILTTNIPTTIPTLYPSNNPSKNSSKQPTNGYSESPSLHPSVLTPLPIMNVAETNPKFGDAKIVFNSQNVKSTLNWFPQIQ